MAPQRQARAAQLLRQGDGGLLLPKLSQRQPAALPACQHASAAPVAMSSIPVSPLIRTVEVAALLTRWTTLPVGYPAPSSARLQ